MDRSRTQDEKISELEKLVSAMQPTLRRLDNEFFNHDGGLGLKTIVLAHISAEDAVYKHNRLIMAAIAFVGLVLAALQLYIDWSHHATNHGLFDSKPKITAPRTTGQVYNAHNNQTQLTEGEHRGNW